jgi:hypothetical protein
MTISFFMWNSPSVAMLGERLHRMPSDPPEQSASGMPDSRRR